MYRLLISLTCVASLFCSAGWTQPSDLEGGVLIAHFPTMMEFSSDPPLVGWCQHYLDGFAIHSCEDQVNRIDTYDRVIWYVLAAWETGKEFCGTEFGLGEYADSLFLFTDYGPCYPQEGLEIPTGSWPGPNEGTALVSTGASWNGSIVPIYFFAGYAYGEGVLPLGEDPATGFGGWSNCESPPQAWDASAFGAMGLFTDGVAVLPGGGPGPAGGEGACCVSGECQILSSDACSGLGGMFFAEGIPCEPNPCLLQLYGGGSQNPGAGEDLPGAETYLATDFYPTTLHVDPGTDDEISFSLAAIPPTESEACQIELYNSRTEDLIYSIAVQITETPQLRTFHWPREDGMARVVLTPTNPDWVRFSYRSTRENSEEATDSELHNGAYSFPSRPGGSYSRTYSFWVPAGAGRVHITMLGPPQPSNRVRYEIWSALGLLKAHGYISASPVVEVDDGEEAGRWTLKLIDRIPGEFFPGYCLIEFHEREGTNHWTPEYAIAPDLEGTGPERRLHIPFGPNELFVVGTSYEKPVGYYAPAGVGIPADTYVHEPPRVATEEILWGGRNRYLFGRRPGTQKSVTLHNLNTSGTIQYAYGIPGNPPEFAECTPGPTTVPWPVGDPAELELLFVEILQHFEPTYDISTDAPFASLGPDRSVNPSVA